MKYVYPAVFEYEEGKGYGVYFPDVEGAFASGLTLYDAIETAEEVLREMLKSMIEDGDEIKPPTPINKVVPEPVKYASEVFVTLIKAAIK